MATNRRRNALLTGANGGFGVPLTVGLLRSGWRVTAVVRGGERRMPLQATIQEALRDGRLVVVDRDLVDYAAGDVPEPLVDGPLDALVNIAGSSVFGCLSDVPLATFRSLLRLNLEVPYALTQAHLPQLVEAQGAVVQVSSLSARQPLPFYGVYAATKTALETLSETLHQEVRSLGVRVHCVQPGAYRTGVQHRMRFIPPASLPGLLPGFERFRRYVADEGIGMAHEPEDVARLVITLCERRDRRFRVPIGPGAWLATLSSALPERLRLAVVRLVVGLRIDRPRSLTWGVGSERLEVRPRT